MRKPSGRQRKAMEKALRRWESALAFDSPGHKYLASRGILLETGTRHRLGVVSSDETGLYEKYAGRLVIPYLDRLGVYGLKFRCIAHKDCTQPVCHHKAGCHKQHDCPKYLNPLDQEVGVYGVLELDDDESETLHVTEGEFDRISLSQHTCEPVVGLPGADAWRDHWLCHFSGFSRVLCWKHGDSAGNKWARRLRDVCRAAEVVELPQGEDVNSLILKWGEEKVLKLADGEGDEE